MKIRVDYVGGDFAIYIGYARPGSLTSSPKWRIVKFTYDLNNNITAADFANGDDNFLYIWDDRTTYTYS